MSQALYRKWRPRRWEEVVGQDAVIRTLRQAVRTGRVAHAYLFSGPRGTGKTTTARLLAKSLNCLHPDPDQRPCDQCEVCQAVNQGRFLDLIEIDAASHTGVDDVRALRDKINYAPSRGRYKVYIIDEVHMLSTAAFNALLKTLEEPPAHAIFVLATTEVHKIPATVRSRCQHYPFRRIPVADIVAYLRRIVEAEGIVIDDAALTYIARQARGGLRDAISLLDQLASLGEPITLSLVHGLLGTAPTEALVQLVDALMARDPAAALQHLRAALDQGTDARQLARQLADYLRQLLRLRLAGPELVEATPEMLATMQPQAAALNPQQATHWLRVLQQALAESRSTTDPGLLLELAVVDAALGPAQTVAPGAAATTKPSPRAARAAAADAPSRAPRPTPVPPRREAAAAPPAPQPKPTPPPPTANDAPPPGVDFSPTLDATRLRKLWPQVQAQARRLAEEHGVPDLPRMLEQVRPLAVRDGVVVLRAPSHLVAERLQGEAYRPALDRALQAALGRQVPWAVEPPRGAPRAGSPKPQPPAAAPANPEDSPLFRELRSWGAQIRPLETPPSPEEDHG